jgi:FAD/FMN-containing dehydrogenase
LSPKVILTPTSATQISSILRICKAIGAKFSVRGGGHLQNPGFTSNNGGVVISMCKFKDISLSADKSVAKISPGLTWLEVYNALDKYDVTVTGGRVPSVGVPGLLLGGGLSFQNSEYGFSCMGVENYEDSQILAAKHFKSANT